MTKTTNKNDDLVNIIKQKINYSFKDKSLLVESLTHKSISSCNYERLEFLGDSIIQLAITSFLYSRYPDHKESFLSREKQKIVSKKILSEISYQYELIDLLIFNNLNFGTDETLKKSISSDILESLIGAIYMDSNYNQCEKIIYSIFDEYLSIKDIIGEKDPKTLLIEFMQAHNYDRPIFDKKHISGPAHKPKYCITCKIEFYSEVFSIESDTVKNGQQKISKVLLDKIKNEKKI